MAYNQSSRFPDSSTNLRHIGPGTYNCELLKKVKPNNVPFLSNTVRNTQPENRVYTEAIYKTEIPQHLGNITGFVSKKPRFQYEALSKEDIENILCRCGIDATCECTSVTDKPEPKLGAVCQGKIQRRIFTGQPPRSQITEGLSTPSKRDHGFDVQSDGTQNRIFILEKEQSAPFYTTEVKETTAFYHGCKWSKRTSKRETKLREKMPGPADYFLEKTPTAEEICNEKVRELKRKTCTQLRFIEMVQQRNILEGRPGPSHYSPKLPEFQTVENPGSKAPRFTESRIKHHPGPAHYFIRRDFERPNPPNIPCHATLPEPPFFGIKSARFKPPREVGPSPASYSPNIPKCHFVHCPTAPFGSSVVRFKEVDPEEKSIYVISVDEPERIPENGKIEACPMHTSSFKSKVQRSKPLLKCPNEPSPADLPQKTLKVNRSLKLQFTAPFYTSERRFFPWKNWIPVQGFQKTPGPAYYCLEKPKCNPAVRHGPLFRAARFPSSSFQTPSPGAYNINGGIETILETHNLKLRGNIENQPKVFRWVPAEEPRRLTLVEREVMLLKKCIDLLGVNEEAASPPFKSIECPTVVNEIKKPKLLRHFLYSHPIQNI